MPDRVDLRFGAGMPDKRIVLRDGAVVIQPQHLSAMRGRTLRVVAGDGHEKRAIAAECNARGTAPLGHEDIPRFHEPAAIPTPSRYSSYPTFLVERLGVGQINEMILRKTGM